MLLSVTSEYREHCIKSNVVPKTRNYLRVTDILVTVTMDSDALIHNAGK